MARVSERNLSRRDIQLAVAGGIAGLLIIVVVWFVVGRTAPSDLPPLASINRPAANFTLETMDGKQLSLEDYRGKVVLLNFWYTTCPPCKEETPALQQAYQQLADQGLVIIGVNVRQNERGGTDGDNDIRLFAKQYGVTYPIVLDRNNNVGRDYQVYVLPTSFFIDPSGAIRYARFSTLTVDEVERVFHELRQR